ncbi:MAG: alkaline phosphatase family protein [Sphingobacteriaceae bacterium]|nr:MAG: alkaline phosphatase family protein [Sphingobacteriaceae bacterium]
MKIKNLLFILLAGCSVSLSAQNKPKTAAANTDLPRPKLVVGLVVDQMRWDYLYRFYSRYGSGGFKRMLNEGFTAENNVVDYIPTVTAAGHATIYTGTSPAIHGIAGNDFIIQATGKSMYCTSDSTVQGVGTTTNWGKMSPRNMLSTTVTDELKLATNFKSKVIGIALKDRGAILPAGHTANAAYWLDDKTGSWISSTYYMKELPQWVKDFNGKRLIEKYLAQDWNTLYPINTYAQSTEDNARYEGLFKGSTTPTFPIKTSLLSKDSLEIIRTTPYGNTLSIDLAEAAINAEKLGQNGVTDFLALSLSSTDYVGHKFGTNSIEIEDTYLRLDRDLAAFFTFLDTKLGKGQYTVFLTADHGAAHNTAFLKDHNIPAGTWDDALALRGLNAQLLEKYKGQRLVLSMLNYQVQLNSPVIKRLGLDEAAIKNDCIQFLQQQPAIAFVVDMQKAQTANIPDDLRERIIKGYNTERSGAIQIILKPGWFSGRTPAAGRTPTGTSHGTWNPYDAHIPFVLMGWGIKHGSTTRETHMTDIAPTIAALLHIQAPNGTIGKPVGEALK